MLGAIAGKGRKSTFPYQKNPFKNSELENVNYILNHSAVLHSDICSTNNRSKHDLTSIDWIFCSVIWISTSTTKIMKNSWKQTVFQIFAGKIARETKTSNDNFFIYWIRSTVFYSLFSHAQFLRTIQLLWKCISLELVFLKSFHSQAYLLTLSKIYWKVK